MINVNTSAAEELAGVLDVSDEVAQDIVTRRERQPFSTFEQLRAVPGVNPDTLEEQKSRILF